MYDRDIYNLESHYHDFYRVKDSKGNRGTAFVFDKLTLKETLDKCVKIWGKETVNNIYDIMSL
jgi:hypothetical protein